MLSSNAFQSILANVVCPADVDCAPAEKYPEVTFEGGMEPIFHVNSRSRVSRFHKVSNEWT